MILLNAVFKEKLVFLLMNFNEYLYTYTHRDTSYIYTYLD